ncbi:MAG: disulfide bond formation protein B [Comamonadaceae bacterium]|nr:MAG: disulfide bond formation protein B [Comamonadaceae bacterium]
MPDRTWSLLLASWVIALVSTLGALFFSGVMDMEPCVLCWYQRIAMFPLVMVLGIGAYSQDRGCVRYALPLALAGWAIAVYHCLLYGGFIPPNLQPCGKGASCAAQKLEVAGFITLPLLSLVAFSTIVLLLTAARKDLGKI